MNFIEKEKLIKADIVSIESRVRHAFNQGYDLGFKDGKKAKPQDIDYKVQYERLSQKAEIVISQLRADRDRLMSLASVTPQEPRWIPCSERLPKIADVYRVTRYYPNNVMNPNYLVDACFFDGSNTWYNDNRINHERGYVVNVIAWQENPEPYKAYKEVEE